MKVLSLIILLFVVASSFLYGQAFNLLGNDLGQSSTGSGISVETTYPYTTYGSIYGKAIGFQIESNPVILTDVQLVLNISSTAQNTFSAAIYSNNGTSSAAPDALLLTLTNPAFSPSALGSIAYTFTTPIGLTLQSNTAYDIVITNTGSYANGSGVPWFYLASSLSNPYSASGDAEAIGMIQAGAIQSAPSTWTASSEVPYYNEFQIDAVAIPETSDGSIMIVGALTLLFLVRRLNGRCGGLLRRNQEN